MTENTTRKVHSQGRRVLGICMSCGNKRASNNANYCEKHRDDAAAKQRNRRRFERVVDAEFPEDLWSKALDSFIK